METEGIRYFLTVAECLNFSEAAERNHISQSSFSKAIMRLEKELNVKLIDRTHHPIILTPAGESFYRDMSSLAPAFRKAVSNVAAFADVEKLDCLICPRSYAIRDAVNSFLEQHPNIRVHLTETSDIAQISDRMLTEKYDFCISVKPMVIPPQLKVCALYDDGLYLIASKESEFAGRESVSLKELNGKALNESPFSWYLLRELMRYFDFKPSRIYPEEELPGIRREEAIHRAAKGKGFCLYLGRDVVMFTDPRIIRIPVLEFPSLPTVLIEPAASLDSSAKQQFRAWMKANLQSFVYSKDNKT